MNNNKTVLLGMSGGIDSSVAAIILKEQGFKVTGITFRVWDYLSASCKAKEKGCCSLDSIIEAKELANKLNIEHHTVDLRNEFKVDVIDNFVAGYLNGLTPNPCIDCNSFIKWKYLLKKAEELNIDYVATGHYAKIKFDNNKYILQKGTDLTKDQSYFLWGLNQEEIKKTIFPLGNYLKSEIKQLAKDKGFVKLSEKKESQEICFIQDNDYRAFLKRAVPDIDNIVGEGNFISVEGKILGKHLGYPYYTIGQRKGLNIAVGHPLYVVKIDKDSNTIVLGEKKDLMSNRMEVGNVNFIKYDVFPEDKELTVKIRYRNDGHKCFVKNENNKILVNFLNDVEGVTKGQSAVFYENDDVVGGGIIL